MKKRRIMSAGLVVLGLLWWAVDFPPTSGTPGPVGIWQVVPRSGDGAFGDPHSFRFDGQYVTLHLITTKAWEWRPNDLYWRLESGWDGDDLYCRGPYGNWLYVATFVNGRFEGDEGWVYQKVDWWSLEKHEQPLIWTRTPYDYSMNPAERGRYRSPFKRWLAWVWDK